VFDQLPADLFGETPAYVYDLDEVRRCVARLRGWLPEPSRIYYSLKANPHPTVVAVLRAAGCHAEVCSPGELATALDAGFPAEHILYTGPGKREQDVTAAIKAGVQLFSVDSPYGIEQIQGADTLLRVNDDTPAPGQGLTMTGVASQFGADASWVLAEPERFAGISGFHFYAGTNIADTDSLIAQFRQSIHTARRLADSCGVAVRVLDLGGGFGAPFGKAGALPCFDGLAERVADLLDDGFPGWRTGQPVLAFESGRHLVGTCGSLHCRVLDVKESHGRQVVVFDSGINHLGGMAGLRRLQPIRPDVLASADRPGAPTVSMLAGPLCTPTDVWSHADELPPVRPGDLVSIPNVGAYGLYASLVGFLGHPMPIEVIVDSGRVVEVSRLQLHRNPDRM
jgi:diaminopimelate decarboxylase